jgi:hypothetical protein
MMTTEQPNLIGFEEVPVGSTVLTDVTYPNQSIKVGFTRVDEDAWWILSDARTETGHPLPLDKVLLEIVGPLGESFFYERGWIPTLGKLFVAQVQVGDSYVYKIWPSDGPLEVQP